MGKCRDDTETQSRLNRPLRSGVCWKNSVSIDTTSSMRRCPLVAAYDRFRPNNWRSVGAGLTAGSHPNWS